MNFSKIILILSLITIGPFSHANDACKETLETHIELIEANEHYLEQITLNAKTITSFEITKLQKSLTARYASLNELLKIYSDADADSNCRPYILGAATAIYDFTRIGQSIISNADLRRIVISFTKHKGFGLTNFIEDYKKYTSNEMIALVQNDINQQKTQLPYENNFVETQKNYDPNLYATSDIVIKATTTTVAGAARIWGFVSDHLKWRQGRLKNDQAPINLSLSKLKPLDLVFEKRTFVLSNYTIPGHWGHVGIWLGTKEELISLNIWNKDFFKPFKAQVEAGNNIVEIRKEGLNFQSLKSFLNLDEFAITRMKGVDERIQSIIEELSLQVDKKYDFKFNARSADAITCTEFISFSYGDFIWPETKTLFQITLRPDDIAMATLGPNPQADFILYLKGTKKKGVIQNFSATQWSKLYNFLTPEEKAEAKRLKKEKYLRDRQEREAFERMYSHG